MVTSFRGKKGSFMSSEIFTVFNRSLTKGLTENVILRNSMWEGENEPCVYLGVSQAKGKESQRPRGTTASHAGEIAMRLV